MMLFLLMMFSNPAIAEEAEDFLDQPLVTEQVDYEATDYVSPEANNSVETQG